MAGKHFKHFDHPAYTNDLEQPTEKMNFSADKVEIIGVSPDPVDKQEAFVTKEKLTVSSTCVSDFAA